MIKIQLNFCKFVKPFEQVQINFKGYNEVQYVFWGNVMKYCKRLYETNQLPELIKAP